MADRHPQLSRKRLQIHEAWLKDHVELGLAGQPIFGNAAFYGTANDLMIGL
jgi:hypothetical protein